MGFRRICRLVFAGWAALLMLGMSPLAVAQTDAPDSSEQVMTHLNQVLRWSRQWETPDIRLARPGDELYLDEGRELARQVLKLEFQSALAQAALIAEATPKSTQATGGSEGSANAQNLLRAQQRVGQQMQNLQAQLDAVNAKISHARAKDKAALTTERDTLQGQLQLAQELHDNLQKLTSFMNSAVSANGVANELTGKIVALQRALPQLTVTSTGNERSISLPRPQMASNPRGSGLIGQMGELFHFVQSLRTLHQLEEEARALQASTRELRTPLLTALRTTLQKGQVALASPSPSNAAAAATPAAPTAPADSSAEPTPETAQQKQREMAALVKHFKLLSNAALPLSQEMILLTQSQTNLRQLQTSVKHDYTSSLRTLLLKAGGILIALGLIWLFSWLWRRASFRYIRDARLRRQFVVLRRTITGFCMFVVILLGFVSDFSSLATYAGLITAGVAVALQAVILSIAAYFFLVGRYGVKVGDRVTVVYNGANSVAGDVVDIGLVRFSLMELAGSGIDAQATGRICVFPNSVLFQTNPLFKQMPGTEYAWREIALPLSADSDGQLAEKELMATVERLYSGYKLMLERQHSSIESAMDVHLEAPKPYSRTRFAGAAVEVMVRYPIPLRQAAELDNRMVTDVSELLRKNPTIKLAAGATPDLRSPVKA